MGKNTPTNTGDIRDSGSIPGSGRSPGGLHGSPLQYSCVENPTDRGAWRAAVPGVAPLDMTERLSTGARLGKEGCNTRKWPQDGAQKRPSPNPRHSRPQEALRASPARGTFPSQGRSCFPGRQGDGDSAPPSRISQGEGRAHRTIQTPCGRAQERAVSSSPGGSSKSMVSKGVGHPHPSVFHAQAGPSLLAP